MAPPTSRARQLGRIDPVIQGRSSPVGQRVARLAAASHEIVTATELSAAGVDRSRRERWLADGRLQLIHPGVYTVGSPGLTREGRWLAAVRSGGPTALLSHMSAAALWGLRPTDPAVIDLILPRSRAGREGIRPHRPRRLSPAERTERLGIPVTTPTRTWLDLAAVLTPHRLKRALSAGERSGVLDPGRLAASLGSRRGVPGLGRARAVLAAYRPAPPGIGFRSDLEREFWEAWLATGREEPEVNARLLGVEVDMLWRRRRLAVELDGDRYHRTGLDRERDRRRDRLLASHGFEVLRIGEHELSADLNAAVARVSRAYRSRA